MSNYAHDGSLTMNYVSNIKTNSKTHQSFTQERCKRDSLLSEYDTCWGNIGKRRWRVCGGSCWRSAGSNGRLWMALVVVFMERWLALGTAMVVAVSLRSTIIEDAVDSASMSVHLRRQWGWRRAFIDLSLHFLKEDGFYGSFYQVDRGMFKFWWFFNIWNFGSLASYSAPSNLCIVYILKVLPGSSAK